MNDAAAQRDRMDSVRRSVAAVWRIESARIIATMTRTVGDFGVAEDLAQEALVDALAQWPQTGIPKNPGAWLTTVAKRKAVDRWRRDERYAQRLAEVARQLAIEDVRGPDADPPWDPDRIDDDVLGLVFIACHPVLAREAQVARPVAAIPGCAPDSCSPAWAAATRRAPNSRRRRSP